MITFTLCIILLMMTIGAGCASINCFFHEKKLTGFGFLAMATILFFTNLILQNKVLAELMNN